MTNKIPDPDRELLKKEGKDPERLVAEVLNREDLPSNQEGARRADAYVADQMLDLKTPEEEVAQEQAGQARPAYLGRQSYTVGASSVGDEVYDSVEDQVTHDVRLTHQYRQVSGQTGYGLTPNDKLEEYDNPEDRAIAAASLEQDYRAQQGLPKRNVHLPRPAHGDYYRNRPAPQTAGEAALEDELMREEDVIERQADASDRSLARDLDRPPIER